MGRNPHLCGPGPMFHFYPQNQGPPPPTSPSPHTPPHTRRTEHSPDHTTKHHRKAHPWQTCPPPDGSPPQHPFTH